MTLVQKRFYLPENLYTNLSIYARKKKKTITFVVRHLLERGLDENTNKENTALSTLQFAQKLKKIKKSSTRDVAQRHDDYFAEAYDNDNC